MTKARKCVLKPPSRAHGRPRRRRAGKSTGMMHDMILFRRFEEKAEGVYTTGKIGDFCHLHIGQEVSAAGSIAALNAPVLCPTSSSPIIESNFLFAYARDRAPGEPTSILFLVFCLGGTATRLASVS